MITSGIEGIKRRIRTSEVEENSSTLSEQSNDDTKILSETSRSKRRTSIQLVKPNFESGLNIINAHSIGEESESNQIATDNRPSRIIDSKREESTSSSFSLDESVKQKIRENVYSSSEESTNEKTSTRKSSMDTSVTSEKDKKSVKTIDQFINEVNQKRKTSITINKPQYETAKVIHTDATDKLEKRRTSTVITKPHYETSHIINENADSVTNEYSSSQIFKSTADDSVSSSILSQEESKIKTARNNAEDDKRIVEQENHREDIGDGFKIVTDFKTEINEDGGVRTKKTTSTTTSVRKTSSETPLRASFDVLLNNSSTLISQASLNELEDNTKKPDKVANKVEKALITEEEQINEKIGDTIKNVTLTNELSGDEGSLSSITTKTTSTTERFSSNNLKDVSEPIVSTSIEQLISDISSSVQSVATNESRTQSFDKLPEVIANEQKDFVLEERQVDEYLKDGVKIVTDVKTETSEDGGVRTKKTTTTTSSVKKRSSETPVSVIPEVSSSIEVSTSTIDREIVGDDVKIITDTKTVTSIDGGVSTKKTTTTSTSVKTTPIKSKVPEPLVTSSIDDLISDISSSVHSTATDEINSGKELPEIKANEEKGLLIEEHQIDEFSKDGARVVTDIKTETSEDGGVRTKKTTSSTTSVKKTSFRTPSLTESTEVTQSISEKPIEQLITNISTSAKAITSDVENVQKDSHLFSEELQENARDDVKKITDTKTETSNDGGVTTKITTTTITTSEAPNLTEYIEGILSNANKTVIEKANEQISDISSSVQSVYAHESQLTKEFAEKLPEFKDNDSIIEERHVDEYPNDGLKVVTDIKTETTSDGGVRTKKTTTTTSSVKKISLTDRLSHAETNKNNDLVMEILEHSKDEIEPVSVIKTENLEDDGALINVTTTTATLSSIKKNSLDMSTIKPIELSQGFFDKPEIEKSVEQVITGVISSFQNIMPDEKINQFEISLDNNENFNTNSNFSNDKDTLSSSTISTASTFDNKSSESPKKTNKESDLRIQASLEQFISDIASSLKLNESTSLGQPEETVAKPKPANALDRNISSSIEQFISNLASTLNLSPHESETSKLSSKEPSGKSSPKDQNISASVEELAANISASLQNTESNDQLESNNLVPSTFRRSSVDKKVLSSIEQFITDITSKLNEEQMDASKSSESDTSSIKSFQSDKNISETIEQFLADLSTSLKQTDPYINQVSQSSESSRKTSSSQQLSDSRKSSIDVFEKRSEIDFDKPIDSQQSLIEDQQISEKIKDGEKTVTQTKSETLKDGSILTKKTTTTTTSVKKTSIGTSSPIKTAGEPKKIIKETSVESLKRNISSDKLVDSRKSSFETISKLNESEIQNQSQRPENEGHNANQETNIAIGEPTQKVANNEKKILKDKKESSDKVVERTTITTSTVTSVNTTPTQSKIAPEPIVSTSIEQLISDISSSVQSVATNESRSRTQSLDKIPEVKANEQKDLIIEDRKVDEYLKDGVKIVTDVKTETSEDGGVRTKKTTTTTSSVKKRSSETPVSVKPTVLPEVSSSIEISTSTSIPETTASDNLSDIKREVAERLPSEDSHIISEEIREIVSDDVKIITDTKTETSNDGGVSTKKTTTTTTSVKTTPIKSKVPESLVTSSIDQLISDISSSVHLTATDEVNSQKQSIDKVPAGISNKEKGLLIEEHQVDEFSKDGARVVTDIKTETSEDGGVRIKKTTSSTTSVKKTSFRTPSLTEFTEVTQSISEKPIEQLITNISTSVQAITSDLENLQKESKNENKVLNAEYIKAKTDDKKISIEKDLQIEEIKQVGDKSEKSDILSEMSQSKDLLNKIGLKSIMTKTDSIESAEITLDKKSAEAQKEEFSTTVSKFLILKDCFFIKFKYKSLFRICMY